MKKLYLRILSSILAVALVISSCVFINARAVDASSEYVPVYDTNGSAVSNHLQVTTANDAYGQHFKTTKPFNSYRIEMRKGSGGDSIDVQLSIYEWNYSYENTLRCAPIVSTTKAVSGTGIMKWYDVTLNKVLPAGEYLFHVSCYGSTTENKYAIAAVYNGNGNGNNYTYKFFQDAVTKQSDRDMKLELGFTENADVYFDKVSQSNTTTLYKHSAYAEDELQSDNLSLKLGSGTKCLSQRLKTTKDIYGFGFETVTWGSKDSTITLSAYQWHDNYEKTLKQKPVISQRVWATGASVKNDRTAWIKFEQALTAGEYLFVLDNADGYVGCKYALTNNTTDGYAYVDGAEMEWTLGLSLFIKDETVSGLFQTVEPVYNSTGSAVAPEETVLESTEDKYTVKPDTWVFTDGLGRESLTNEDVGDPKTDKNVAIFYWDWHQNNGASTGYNIQKTIDAGNTSKLYKSETLGSVAYWNEPIYGYYTSSDQWVLRKQSELLANAGIDTIFLDYSNAMATYRDSYISLYDEWSNAMESGVNTPKISYYLPMRDDSEKATQNMLKLLYSDLYLGVEKGSEYQKLWFYYEGKPMLIAKQADFQNPTDNLMQEIKDFFTFRNPDENYTYAYSGIPTDTWGWSSIYPQTQYKASGTTNVEEMAVSPAQNWNSSLQRKSFMNGLDIRGRSYTYNTVSKESGAEASKYGYNLKEQFDHALKIDPEILYITGWNEWTVGRAEYTGNRDLLSSECNGYHFMDQYNDEYSRDIEPSKGELKDHYYYQVVNNIRKYKGVNAIEKAGAAKKIVLNSENSTLKEQWENVTPYFAAYQDNIQDRDSGGRVATITDGTTTSDVYYKDQSGRNDIVCSQVARDMEYVYFNIECKDNITSPSSDDSLWMNLYIDSDQTNQGWETFDYVVRNYGKSNAELLKFTGTGNNSFDTVKVDNVSYELEGKYLTIKIPKASLELSGYDFTINFSCTDNVHDDSDISGDNNGQYENFSGDIMDFYISGDVAPGGRFKYSYISTAAEAQKSCNDNAHADENCDGKCDACGMIMDGFSSLAGYSAKLKDNICFEVYLDLESSEIKPESFVKISYPNGTSENVLISEAQKDTETIPGKTLYIVSCDVAAKEMTDIIELQVYPDGSEGTKGTCYKCSVKDYADIILNNQNVNEYQQAAKLVEAMLHYGGYAQKWFSYNLSKLADATLDSDDEMQNVTSGVLSQYRHSAEMSKLNDSISFEGVTLLLETNTALRFFFTLNDNVEIDDVNFVCNQKELEPFVITRNNTKYYCVDINDISAQELDDSFDLVISYDGNEGTISACALSYCYEVLDNPSFVLPINLTKALYLYNVAAEEYFALD